MASTNDTLSVEFGASEVSGFYGPGSLIAWWMQCASFALDICFKPGSTPPQLSQRNRSLTGQLVWFCLSLSVVAGFAYIAQRDLKGAAHENRSTAAFHAPVAVLLQYNLITFIFLALRFGRLLYDLWVSYYKYTINQRDDNNGDDQKGRVNALRPRGHVNLPFYLRTVAILLPSFLLRDTKRLVNNTLRNCSAFEDPSTNSSLTCLENYAVFLDTYVPGKPGPTEYLTAKTYPVPLSIGILSYFFLFAIFSLSFMYYTSSYRASWRHRPGWRGRFAAVDLAIPAMKDRVVVFGNIFLMVRFSGVIIAPDAIMWIVHGRIRGLMPLTTTSLSDQDQLAAVALGGLAFLLSQKDLIVRSWSLIEKALFRGFNSNSTLEESVVELEPMGTWDNQDGHGHGRASDRRPKA